MPKLLALSAALALALAACATAPVSPDKTTVADAKPPAGCVGQTATLIPLKDPSKSCAGFGNVYTQDDINKTGQMGDLGRALMMLDPAISRR